MIRTTALITIAVLTIAVLNYGAYPRQAVHVERSLGGDRDIVEEAEALRGVGVGSRLGLGSGSGSGLEGAGLNLARGRQ